MATPVVEQESLFTLTAFAPTEDREQFFRDFVQAIHRHLPCKVFRVEERPFDLHYVLPELHADRPSYLFWGADLGSSLSLFEELSSFVQRIIIDADTEDDWQQTASTVLQHQEDAKVPIVDIAWARLTRWCQLLSRLFPSREEAKLLAASKEVTIAFNASPHAKTCSHPHIRAAFFQAWLASSLGWEPVALDEKAGLCTYRGEKGEVRVLLEPREDKSRFTGSLLGFQAKSAEGLSLSIQRQPNSDQVSVHYSSPTACNLPTTARVENSWYSYRLIKDLFFAPQSPHYLDALRVLRKQQWGS